MFVPRPRNRSEIRQCQPGGWVGKIKGSNNAAVLFDEEGMNQKKLWLAELLLSLNQLEGRYGMVHTIQTGSDSVVTLNRYFSRCDIVP